MREGEQVSAHWGPATAYLHRTGLIANQHEAFATALYTLISDTSIHPPTADFEYARLLRIVVIESPVMFLAAVKRRVTP